jgi:hypothetical protein
MFVYAMLVMGASAPILGLRHGLTDGNVMGGLMTAYFVGTALTTVRPAAPWTRRINAAALTFALRLALVAIVGGVKAVNTPRVSPGGVPFRTIGVMSFVLATVLLLAIGRAHHAIRPAPRRAAPGAPSVAHVLRAVQRRRLVLLDPCARGENPSRALHDWADARAADPAAVWRDVLLVVEGPRPPHVASARPTRFGRAPTLTADYAARMRQGRNRPEQPAKFETQVALRQNINHFRHFHARVFSGSTENANSQPNPNS